MPIWEEEEYTPLSDVKKSTQAGHCDPAVLHSVSRGETRAQARAAVEKLKQERQPRPWMPPTSSRREEVLQAAEEIARYSIEADEAQIEDIQDAVVMLAYVTVAIERAVQRGDAAMLTVLEEAIVALAALRRRVKKP